MKKFMLPVRVLSSDAQGAQRLLKPHVMQIGLSEPDLFPLNGGEHVLLDFGRELAGGARILAYAAEGNKRLRLRFGESVSECCAEIGESNATNDHSLRDFTVEIQNWSDMTFGSTGFRFLRLDAEEGSRFQIKAVAAVPQIDERPLIGSFECDDERVNEIYRTAAYTLRLCIQNGYLWDGVKRDRLVWIGDLFAEIHAVYCLYGNLPEVRGSIDFSQADAYPPAWINGIPMYSLWWLMVLADEYFHTGDGEYVRAKLPYIADLLRAVAEQITEEGETTFSYNFVDWSMHYSEGEAEEKRSDELAGVHFLTKLALGKTDALLSELGEDNRLCRELLARLNRKTPQVRRYKQAAALGILAGENKTENLSVLTANGAEGLSVFLSYHLFSALAKSGEYERALSDLRTYYGGMLDLGATTFWEDFDLNAAKNASRIDEFPEAGKTDFHRTYGIFCYQGLRHSLCHGWSSGVIPYLTETVLGVTEIGTGGTELVISPHLSGLKHVKGVYPTALGPVSIEHTLLPDGTVQTHTHAPDGVRVTVK